MTQPGTLSHINNVLEQMLADADKASARDKLDDSLKAMLRCRHQVQQATSELNSTNSALELVLELLDAAHDKALSGDQLHCLLQPLQEKLALSLTNLDEVL